MKYLNNLLYIIPESKIYITSSHKPMYNSIRVLLVLGIASCLFNFLFIFMNFIPDFIDL